MSNSGSNTWTIVGLVFFVLALALGISEYFTAMALYSAKVKAHDYETLTSRLNSENSKLEEDAKTLAGLIGVGGETPESVVAETSAALKNVAGDQSEAPKSCLSVIEGLVRNLKEKDFQQALLPLLLCAHQEQGFQQGGSRFLQPCLRSQP